MNWFCKVIHYVKNMFLVFVVILAVLTMEALVCYWFYLIHWTAGLFVICAVLALDISAWLSSR